MARPKFHSNCAFALGIRYHGDLLLGYDWGMNGNHPPNSRQSSLLCQRLKYTAPCGVQDDGFECWCIQQIVHHVRIEIFAFGGPGLTEVQQVRDRLAGQQGRQCGPAKISQRVGHHGEPACQYRNQNDGEQGWQDAPCTTAKDTVDGCLEVA